MDHNLEKFKTIEKELALHKEKLKISQSLVKIGFWELNLKNMTVLLSDEAFSILKLKETNKPLSVNEFASISSENERKLVNKEMMNLIDGKNNLDLEFTLNQHITKENIIVKAIASGTAESKQAPNTIIGIVQDITDQKNTEKLLKIAKERAEEADILKSAFLANMSHEIRTPLNAILGFSRLLTNPVLENEQRKEYSEYITSSANNLLNLIRDIVDVSKIEAGKISIEKNKCLVNKILKELKFTFEKEKTNQAKEHIDILLSIGINDNNFAIHTDPFRFHQILVNLIGNALKFIENGYIQFGYVVNSESVLQFYVKDTGIGIPEDKIDLIFSRFGQIINNKIKNPGGTGLGLSITKHLVDRLGGRIWVESEPGVGTTFYFTLPFEQIKSSDYEQSKTEKEFERLEMKNLKILAVEDDPINMILLENTLKLNISNLQISKAHNGIEALKILKTEDFDLIIMDIRMPKMNGYSTTERIRKNFSSPKNQIPILGLSAHALKKEIEKGKKIGMNDFLSKPIQPEELFLKIKQLCSVKQPVSENRTSELQKQLTAEYQSIDLSFFIKLFKANQEKIKNTLRVYIKQIPEQIIMLQSLLKSRKTEKLKTVAHSLKSTFKYIGRSDISEIAHEIEMNSGEKNKELMLHEKIAAINKEWLIIQKEIIEKVLKEKETSQNKKITKL